MYHLYVLNRASAAYRGILLAEQEAAASWGACLWVMHTNHISSRLLDASPVPYAVRGLLRCSHALQATVIGRPLGRRAGFHTKQIARSPPGGGLSPTGFPTSDATLDVRPYFLPNRPSRAQLPGPLSNLRHSLLCLYLFLGNPVT